MSKLNVEEGNTSASCDENCSKTDAVKHQASAKSHNHHHHHHHDILAEDAGVIFDGDGASQILGSDSEAEESEADTEKSFRIIRPVYTQEEFDECHGGKSVRTPFVAKIKSKFSSKKYNPRKVQSVLWNSLPFLKIMKNYNFKEWFLSDAICGLTVGIMHIPQGMAYAFLAALPPYIGLYTSFFPPLIYFFFGTSRQISMGTIAIVSLLTGSLLETRFPAPTLGPKSNMTNSSFFNSTSSPNSLQGNEAEYIKSRIALASLLCCCVGAFQLAMGILRLGFLTRYLSDPLVSGFTMGASFHVFTSQIKYALGLDIPRRNGVFKIPLHYYDIFKNIANTNLITLAIAAVAIVILFVFKTYVNPRLQKKIKAPLPIELLIVVIGTLVSYFLDLKKNYNVKIVGHIPMGIPAPELPSLSLFNRNMIIEVITISIISFSVCVSLAKIFAKKHNYEVDPSQELVAYGVSNFVSGFFHCWPAASSLSRSAVQDSMKGKTQLVAIFSSCLLLLVLLLIGKYFETVPNCCLSAIILVALKGMFVQIKELPTLWKLSSYDFWTWIVTCLCVILLDVEYGLVIGIAFSICTVIVRTQAPTSSTLGRIPCTDLYKNVEAYSNTEEIPGIKVYRFEGSIYFACADNFRLSMYKRTGVNPRKIIAKRKKVLDKYHKLIKEKESKNKSVPCFQRKDPTSYSINLENGKENEDSKIDFASLKKAEKVVELKKQGLEWPSTNIHHIILDASTWGYMDFAGVRVLNQVIQEYRSIDIHVFLANPKCGVRECLERSDFYGRNKRDIIYVSVHDGVIAAQFEQKMHKKKANGEQSSTSNEDELSKNDEESKKRLVCNY